MKLPMILVLAAALGLAGPACAQQPPANAREPSRPMTVDDLFALSELADVTCSPDGRWVATTITRPGVTDPCPTCPWKATGDVWLVDALSGERRNLTNGAADGSSSWLPVWSPDGHRLAFVSTRLAPGEAAGSSDFHLYVWDADSGRTSRMSDRGVWLQVEFRGPARPSNPYIWLDDRTLLAALLPPGTSAEERILYWKRGAGDATRAWQKWGAGEVTAGVLESGAPPAELPLVSLARVDAVEAAAQSLAELPRWDLWDLRVRMQVAVLPDFRRAAVVAVTGTLPMGPGVAVSDAIRTYRCASVDLSGPGRVRWVALPEASPHVDGEILDWSSDGRAFAVAEAAAPGTRSGDRRVLLVSAEDASARPLEVAGASVDRVAWTAGGDLLAHAVGSQDGSRADWWWIDSDGVMPPKNVTASFARAPSRVLPEAAAPDSFLCLADDALWAIDARSLERERLTSASAAVPGSITPLAPDPSASRTELLLGSRADNGPAFSYITLQQTAGKRTVSENPIPFPSPTASFEAGEPRSDALVFRDETPQGTILWATDGRGAQARKILALNEQVASIAEGQRILVSYRGSKGAELKGVAILPPAYETGKRYPVVTWAYAGLVLRDTHLAIAGKSSTRTLNLEPLAGHGYVVLVPSIPMSGPGASSDPSTEIPESVLPCVDKLVEMEIADPERLAVMGHSAGGYTTYALVTSTNRFKAAIAMSGHPDLISLYTQFFPGERMSDHAHEGLATAAFDEEVLGLDVPPWQDFERYERNSPLYHFDRVSTPLLIVHGDMDGAPIQQGEEAFMALYRMGKRARFVRYFGEGHVVGSPANVRHLWAQIFDWLDTYLGDPVPKPGK